MMLLIGCDQSCVIDVSDWLCADLFRHCLSMSGNTLAFNATGHPAISVNAGYHTTDDGARLPVGMMIVGKKFDDVTVLQVARAVEKVTGSG